MALYLGIDAGGSKTECAVASGQDVIGRSTAGSCKIQQVGREAAAKNLLVAVRGALAAAKVEGREIARSCVGISGISNPEVADFVKSTLGPAIAGEVMCVGDHIIAHETAFRGEAGVLVIAGTGSIVYGRSQRGYTARAGGRGAEASDEGSGFWIGREAIAAALRVADAGQVSELLRETMDKWKVGRDQLKAMLNSTPPSPFAELFRQVLAAGRGGDSSARKVLSRAGAELANLALHVIAKLWPHAEDSVHVAGAGGVLTHSPEVRGPLRDALRISRPEVIYDERVVHPVEGALFLARRAAAATGYTATPQK